MPKSALTHISHWTVQDKMRNLILISIILYNMTNKFADSVSSLSSGGTATLFRQVWMEIDQVSVSSDKFAIVQSTDYRP